MTTVAEKARSAYGELPENWTSRRLRFDVRLNPKKSALDMKPDELVSFVPMDAVGEHGGLRLDENRELADVYEGYTYFEDGDLCIAKITPCFENGKGALAEGLTNGVGFGTTELHVVRPSSGIDRRFLFYISISNDFRKIGESEMYGAGGQKRIDEGFIKDWMPPLPPLETQRRIAQFLDEKTARIDVLIEKKRALLDRLAEKRQALITRAVTKGLNPDAPMKSSGIDWLGDIPEHWEVLPLRRITTNVATGRTPPSTLDYFSKGELNWFTPGDFSKGIELDSSARRIIPEAIEDGVCTLFPENTVFLVGIGATLGKVAVSTAPGSANQQINAIVPDHNSDSYFLAYFLHGFRNEVRVMSNGNTLGILNQSGTKSLLIPVPPLSEQKNISTELKNYDQREINTILRIENSIELLNQYRSAVITSAVTGQIGGLR
jgi:type I restriction enzyme, S subunit